MGCILGMIYFLVRLVFDDIKCHNYTTYNYTIYLLHVSFQLQTSLMMFSKTTQVCQNNFNNHNTFTLHICIQTHQYSFWWLSAPYYTCSIMFTSSDSSSSSFVVSESSLSSVSSSTSSSSGSSSIYIHQ